MKLIQHTTLTLLLLFCVLALHAQSNDDVEMWFDESASIESPKIHRGNLVAKYGAVPGSYNFWMYTPADYEPHGHPCPLVIFLHGRSLCGHDLNKVKRYGVLDAIKRGKIVDAMVLAPQNPGEAWKPEKLNALLEWVKANYNLDEKRVYVIGMSLGGYGTMDFVGTYPDKIAAGMALCGGCYLKDYTGLSKAPLWIMHGTADRAVPVSESKKVVKYLQDNCDTSLLRYDWVAGGSHGLLARLFYMQKAYDWLFSHSLDQRPRKVDRTFDIDQKDFNQTYQELKWFKGLFDND